MDRSLLRSIVAALLCLAAGCSSESRSQSSGSYRVGSNVKDDEALGGFGPCNNLPKWCRKDSPGAQGQLSLVACSEDAFSIGGRKEMPVRLVNRTGKTVPFSACDSRLYLVLQALDRDGTWRNLEAFPNIHCGNSHHRVFLETDQYWEVFAFLHDGEFPTKLRFCLEPQRNAMNGEQADTIYSNEFAGAVDPSAFLRLTRH